MITAKEVRERFDKRRAEQANRAADKGDAEKLIGTDDDKSPAPGGETVPLAVRARLAKKKPPPTK